LHFGRAVRACIQLQSLRSSLFDVARDLGYPDGFALSNQMSRLTGVRPSVAREHLGWEWILEGWLRREASTGGFTGEHAALLGPPQGSTAPPPTPPASHSQGSRSPTSRVGLPQEESRMMRVRKS
jgi:hypothetical protein